MTVVAGGTLGIEELFRAHARFVASFALRLGVPRAEVDDVVQEVFVVAHRKGGFDVGGGASPRSWLGAITIRVASNVRRARSRHQQRVDHISEATEQTSGRTPARSLEVTESLRRVQQALDALDANQRAVFVMYELEGFSCVEIAEALAVPVGTVYSRLHAARRGFSSAHVALRSSRPPSMAEGA